MKHKEAAHLLAFLNLNVFFVIPAIIYVFNIDQWNYDYWLVVFFSAFGVFSFLILFIIYYIIRKFSNKFSKIFVYSFFSLGLIIILNDLLSPLKLGLLDGSRIHSDEPIFNTILELVITLGATFLVWFSIKDQRTYINLIIKSSYLITFGLIISILIINTSNKLDNFERLKTDKNQVIKSLPNIYHFHIDGMQTDYFLRYIHNNPEIKNTLSGFTLYEKNIANYPSTMLSLPSYLTSTTHLEGRFDKWLESYDDGLIKKLKNSGYNLIHSSNAPYRSKYFDEIIAIPELLKRYNGAQHLSIVEFTRIWFARIAPNFLTNESLPLGKSFGKRIFYIINPSQDADIALTMEDGTAALSGILLFEDMIKDINYYSKDNQYIFMLNSILHDGYVSSPECTIEETDFPVAKRYYRQLECTMNLIKEFVSILRSINKYDNSLIIIHGDHGSHFAGQLLDIESGSFKTNTNNKEAPYDESIASYSLSSIESKARALLMIKPVESFGDLKVSYKKTQLLDIYPTIMGQLKINNLKNIEGLDIYKDNLKNRSRYFYYMAGNRYDTQVGKFHTMYPIYNKGSGVLSLASKEMGKTTAYSFFKNSVNVKKYKDIKFYYSMVDGEIITDVEWVFLDGIDLFNNWGAWTNSKKIIIAFYPEDKISENYEKLVLKISDININNINNQISSKFFFNNKLIGSLDFAAPKGQYSFPKIVEFPLPRDAVIEGSPNIFEIHIENGNFKDSLLGLGLVEVSLR